MTNLENFLNKNNESVNVTVEIIDGTFMCQNSECNITSYEAIMDTNDGSVHWLCTCGHRSRFKI